jgi:hypothetical protein
MLFVVVLLALALALAAPAATGAPAPPPQWKAVYSGEYGLNVPAGASREMRFSVPPRLGTTERPLTYSWTVIRPTPLPALVALEQCPQPDVCYPSVLRPNGQGNGTTKTMLRITNRSIKPLDILFRYTVWEAR